MAPDDIGIAGATALLAAFGHLGQLPDNHDIDRPRPRHMRGDARPARYDPRARRHAWAGDGVEPEHETRQMRRARLRAERSTA